MSLLQSVQQVGLDKTDAEIVAALDADVDLAHDHSLWTYAGVANLFGLTAAEGIAQAIAAAGLSTAVVVYAAHGFDLSLDATREQLDAIAAAVPQLATVCAALKAIGRPTQKQWQNLGLDALPSESDVAAARQGIANQQEKTAFANNVWNAAVNDPAVTPAQLKQLVADWIPLAVS